MFDWRRLIDYKYIILLFLSGVILMVFPSFPKENDEKSIQNIVSDNLEKRICETLIKTYHLERADVIITYDTNGEKIIEYNYEQTISDDDNKSKKTYQKNYVTDKSSDIPFVKSEKLPGVRGVLVSVSGGNEDIYYDIRSAVSTLLGVSVNKVNIIFERE